MARCARIKPIGAIYHVMCRSVSEVSLFMDEDDKNYYLDLLKRYCDKFKCSIFAYCLMNNHLHLHFDPKGYDLSKFMHCLNTAYVIYFNKKYKRFGPLFQGKFQSKVVASEKYSLALSAYIHNNPKDIEGYKGKEEEYPFSSMGIYTGKIKDKRKLINMDYILGIFNSKDKKSSLIEYIKFVKQQQEQATDKSIQKCLSQISVNIYCNGRPSISRSVSPKDIMTSIIKIIGANSLEFLKFKYNRKVAPLRAYSAYVLRILCGCSYKEICKSIGNITVSGASRLCSKGYELIKHDNNIRRHFDGLVSLCV